MPRMTEATNSPNKMMVSSPNRSGKCVAPSGDTTVLRDAGHELPMSIKRAKPHPTYRWGGESNAEAVQRIAAATSPTIRRLPRVTASGARMTSAVGSGGGTWRAGTGQVRGARNSRDMIVATIDELELSAFAEATADRPFLWSLAAVLSPLPCEGRVRVQRFAQPVVWNPSPQS